MQICNFPLKLLDYAHIQLVANTGMPLKARKEQLLRKTNLQTSNVVHTMYAAQSAEL